MTFEAGKYIKKDKTNKENGTVAVQEELYAIESSDVKSSIPGVTAIILVNGVVVKSFHVSTLIWWLRNNNKVFVSFKSGPQITLILPDNNSAITVEEEN